MTCISQHFCDITCCQKYDFDFTLHCLYNHAFTWTQKHIILVRWYPREMRKILFRSFCFVWKLTLHFPIRYSINSSTKVTINSKGERRVPIWRKRERTSYEKGKMKAQNAALLLLHKLGTVSYFLYAIKKSIQIFNIVSVGWKNIPFNWDSLLSKVIHM